MKTYKVGNWEAVKLNSASVFWDLMYFGNKKATYSPFFDSFLFENITMESNLLKDLYKLVNLIKKDYNNSPKKYTPITEDAIVELGQRVQSLELELSKLKQL